MIATLVIAILFGLIAVVLIRNYVGTPGKAGGSAANGSVGAVAPVVVAALPIAHGATLRPAMLKVVNYPRSSVPAGAFQTIAQLTGAAHASLRAFTPNEAVIASAVTGAGAKANLSFVLAPGMRAISVRSSDIAGVGGFVLPGDRVDILATRTIGNGDNSVTVTQALAENALVLGVDQSDDQTADKPVVVKAITVEVTPDQAQSISLAQSVGAVTLALRHIADGAPLIRRATTVKDLGTFGYRPKPADGAETAHPGKPRLAPGMTEVRVIRGVEIAGYAVRAF